VASTTENPEVQNLLRSSNCLYVPDFGLPREVTIDETLKTKLESTEYDSQQHTECIDPTQILKSPQTKDLLELKSRFS
jgi:hypothetical protein